MKPLLAFEADIDPIVYSSWLQALRAALPEFALHPMDELDELARKKVEVAIVANPKLERLAKLDNLRWVQSLWAGVDTLLPALAASSFAGKALHVVRLEDPELARTMAEAALAWCLYLHRDMPSYARNQQQKLWQKLPLKATQERHIGVLGFGHMGYASATMLRQFGFSVSGYSLGGTTNSSALSKLGIALFHGEQLAEFLSRSDILLLQVPLTPNTYRLINRDRLAQLPVGAAVINFARGAVLDSAALLAALDANQLSHAVLDVFEQEPLPVNSALWQHEKITVLPHISAPTNLTTASVIVAENIRRYFASGALPNAVDLRRGY